MGDLDWLREEASYIKRMTQTLTELLSQHNRRVLYNITNPDLTSKERQELADMLIEKKESE